MAPPNKGQFGGRAFVLFSEVVLLKIACSCMVWTLVLVEAKELAEIQVSGVYAMISNNIINNLYHIWNKLWVLFSV